MLMRALFVHIAHETAGAARIRHSLRPLNRGGRKNSSKARAHRAARMRNYFHVVPDKRSAISDAQLRIGGPITTGSSFANGPCFGGLIEKSRGIAGTTGGGAFLAHAQNAVYPPSITKQSA